MIEFLLLLLTGLLAGLMIGSVGIGGVILVPILSYVGGIGLHNAIAAAMFAFLISGATGTLLYAKNRSIDAGMAAWLFVGAMPAAFAGALTASVLPTTLLELCLGLLAAITGLHSLKEQGDQSQDAVRKPLLPGALVAIGVVTGILSALTGTGGPLVLIPILMWCRVPVLTAIGLSQAIQLPIGTLATAGNLTTGSLDLTTGVMLGIGISLGTIGGGKLAHRLPRAILKRIVCLLLILVGLSILIKLGYAQI